MLVLSLGWEDSLEKGIATPSSILAWRIPWTKEPGGLQSMEWQSQTRLSTHAHIWYLTNNQFKKLMFPPLHDFPTFYCE